MHFCLTTYNQSGEQKKEQYINISGLTVGQAQEKTFLKKVAQNPRVQDALKKGIEVLMKKEA